MTGAWLNKMLIGHLNYYAVPLNARSVTWFFSRVIHARWNKT